MWSLFTPRPSPVLPTERTWFEDRGQRRRFKEKNAGDIPTHKGRRTLESCNPLSFRFPMSLCLVFIFFFLAQQIPRASAQVGRDDEDDDYYDSYEEGEEEHEEPDTKVALSRATRGAGSYYDFIINEFSYKIWAAFMIYDIVCVFYSCLVATYFAEVNTLAPTPAFDYDYIRSFSGSDEDALQRPLPLKPHQEEIAKQVLQSISSTPSPQGIAGGGKVDVNKGIVHSKE